MSVSSGQNTSSTSVGGVPSRLGDLLGDKDELGPYFAAPDADIFFILRYLYSIKFRGTMPSDISDLFASLEHPSVASTAQARAISVFRGYRNSLIHGNISKLPPLIELEEACAVLQRWVETFLPVQDNATADSSASASHMIVTKFARLLHEVVRRTLLAKRDEAKTLVATEIRTSTSNPANPFASLAGLVQPVTVAHVSTNPIGGRSERNENLSALTLRGGQFTLPINPDMSPDKPTTRVTVPVTAIPISFPSSSQSPSSSSSPSPVLQTSLPAVASTNGLSTSNEVSASSASKSAQPSFPSSGFKVEGTLKDIREEKSRDWLKGRRLMVLDGKHAHRTGTFHSWSGTVAYVVFDDTNEKIALSVSRRVGVFH